MKLIPLRGILANDAKKFKVYCAYAFGVPLAVTLVTIILHFLPDEKVADGVLRPGFGEVACWFKGMVYASLYVCSCVCFCVSIYPHMHTRVHESVKLPLRFLLSERRL